jgi:hypothetical protein
VTEWEPATETEAAMRDALRAGDQELYFRILSRADLLLPVSAEALAGRAPMGWGTWTTGGRTHVLAFTSPATMQACLAGSAGSYRRTAYADLAAGWPNPEWWLAVNPGLPIEGYLPAWFISQLGRGDVRLPGRTRARLEQVERVARARATATVPRHTPPGRAVPADPADPGRLFRSPTPPTVVTPPSGPPETVRPTVDQTVGGYVASSRGSHGDGDGSQDGEPTVGWMTPARRRPTATPNGGPSGLGSENPWLEPRRPAPSPWTPPTAVAAPAEPEAVSAAGVEVSLFEPASRRSGRAGDADPTGSAPTASAPGAPPAGDGSGTDRTPAPGSVTPPRQSAVDFTPANDVERSLIEAAEGGSTDSFLSTLLLARVLLPVAPESAAGSRPGDDGFRWRTEVIDGTTYVVVFTSPERLADHLPTPVETVEVRFVQLIRRWPDEAWSFAVNPGTPVGAKLPGSEIIALANWAAEVGLGDDPESTDPTPAAPAEEEPVRSTYAPAREDPGRPTMMQKTISPSQLSYYLERGYDRVSGFVHRASEVAHLRTPARLYAALGLGYPNSPFSRDAEEVHVLRWPAYRPSLYRIPYGGQNEAAMRAMEGWVIERPPFRGNGFAPGESSDVVAEFKVDSVRLPHGAQIWRIGADGSERLVATLDCDVPVWRRVEED